MTLPTPSPAVADVLRIVADEIEHNQDPGRPFGTGRIVDPSKVNWSSVILRLRAKADELSAQAGAPAPVGPSVVGKAWRCEAVPGAIAPPSAGPGCRFPMCECRSIPNPAPGPNTSAMPSREELREKIASDPDLDTDAAPTDAGAGLKCDVEDVRGIVGETVWRAVERWGEPGRRGAILTAIVNQIEATRSPLRSETPGESELKPCFWPQCSNRKRCNAFGSCVALTQRRISQLEMWLNDAAAAIGGADLDCVGNAIRTRLSTGKETK